MLWGLGRDASLCNDMHVWTQILLLSGLIMNFDGITWIKQPQPDAEGDTAEVSRLVAEILRRVRAEGDAAVADLGAAADWAESRGVSPYVPVTPGLPGTAAAEAWLVEHGFEPAYAWMKFVRGQQGYIFFSAAATFCYICIVDFVL